MKFYKVTEVEFDFDYEDLTEDEKQTIISDTKECLWDSPIEGELMNVISDHTGWLVKSLSYDIV